MIAVQQTCRTRGGKITIDRVITGPENRFMRNKEMCRVRAPLAGGGKFNFKGSATHRGEAISQLILITTDPYNIYIYAYFRHGYYFSPPRNSSISHNNFPELPTLSCVAAGV